MDGAESQKSSNELPEAVAASFVPDNTSVHHQKAKVETEDDFF
jgi:hypothetical protein